MSKEEQYKPKMRIQLLTDNGVVISDRLVDQAIETYTGPKEKHLGPLKIEFCLMNQADIKSITEYLTRLAGDLPVKEVGKQGRKAKEVEELSSPRESILKDVTKMIEVDGENQDAVIKYLRSLGFVFLLTEDFLTYFPDFPFNKKDISEPNHSGQYLEGYQWLVRRIKTGKDPKTDKYDPQIIFGFKIMGERYERFVCYLYKERSRLKAVIPKKNALSFNNTEMTKFPKYMTEEERLKFSTEMRQLSLNQSKLPSKFFRRWYQDVTFPDTIKENMAKVIARK